jgi:hypothetical protein
MWEEKVDKATAEKEVSALLDKKRIKPLRREALALSIKNVVEAITLGFVSIAEDGSIRQTLDVPVGSLTEINYKARVEPTTINSAISNLKSANTATHVMVYTQAYTGLLTTQINSLEPSDKETCEAITTFFL